MRLVAALLAAFVFAPTLAQTPAVTPADKPAASADKPAYESDSKFVSAMADGKNARREDKWGDAESAFKKAIKISGGQCRRCLNDLYAVQIKNHSFKDAATTATQLQAIADSPKEKSSAEGKLGEAIFYQGGEKPKPAQLAASHDALQAAIADNPANTTARYTDGCVLAYMGKNDEAGKAFAECAQAMSDKDAMKVRVTRFAENPALARAKMAPAFELTALDGTRFNLDEMYGKVVLLDFWATWCGPCNEELPEVKKIARDFAGQPLVILSISSDDDDAKWRAFVAKNDMTWLQFRDKSDRIGKLFNVSSIPHYFTIDSDGVLQSEILGSGSDVEGKLKKLVKHAREARPLAPATTQASTR